MANIRAESEIPPRPGKPDIKYRGPLSYRELRIIGWLCFALAQVATVLGLASSSGALTANVDVANRILSFMSSLMMPLFLLANLGLILKERATYKRILLLHGGLTLLIALIYYIMLERYLMAIANFLTGDPEKSHQFFNIVLNEVLANGLNVFLDLFLCTLFSFFLNYFPKHVFTGKKIIIFRLFTLLVIGYEVFCFILKYNIARDVWSMPAQFFPWIASKPISVFVAFALIALSIKIRELVFVKKGNTREQWLAYEQTNRNSLRVSVTISIIFAVVGVADFAILIAVVISNMTEGMNQQAFDALVETFSACGLGRGIVLLLVVPIVLLYSYKAERKNKMIDKLLPAAGILLVVLIYLEGFYNILNALASKGGA